MDKLAGTLVKLKGLSVTNIQAVEIQQLYHDLHDIYKRSLEFQSCHQEEGLEERRGKANMLVLMQCRGTCNVELDIWTTLNHFQSKNAML